MPTRMPRSRGGEPLFDVVSYGRVACEAGGRLTPAQVEQIRSTVQRTPEAVVKVLPRASNDLKAVGNHLNYIGRDGALELETDDGEHVSGSSEKTLLDDWDLDIDDARRQSALAATKGRGPPKLVHKLMFSMPPGTPPDKVLGAVRNFARNEFWGQHRYAFALHTDEAHPHVHLVLKAVSEQGVRLNIRKATLRHWRSEFARNLRLLGVEANATERALRGESGKLTVIDATNVQPEARKSLIALAREYHCLPVALVLDFPERICRERNAIRTDRNFGEHVIRNQCSQLRKSLRGLEREGFRHVSIFRSPEELAGLTVRREPLWNNKKAEVGPFDIIGDIHGCLDEALELVASLGYSVVSEDGRYNVSHPDGRKLIFVGDLVDRGPNSPGVIRLAMDSVASGAAFCVAGNHDVKLSRALRGRDVKLTHGLAESLEQLKAEADEFKATAAEWLDGLVSHYVFDGGKLVVAHAGLREEMHGRGSGAVRQFAMYGETTGETDEYGLPVRYNWAADYRGKAMVVYGHTPVPEAEWINNTICLDTGCVFGGKLTALRYPEREIVSVAASRMYYAPVKPFQAANAQVLSTQQDLDDLLDLEDVTGKRLIETRLHRSITIREENSIAALEVMSRFAANPKWLIYLPPTMSPSETSRNDSYLEYPTEALDYYRRAGVESVVCEEKHMGSRAVVVICRDEAAALKRFGIQSEGRGIIYTRTGRRFFADDDLHVAVLDRLGAALEQASFWDRFQTDWFCLDCELMPWSVKAEDLLRTQYAPTGAAARVAVEAARSELRRASSRGLDVSGLEQSFGERATLVDRYVEAYRHYCWPVVGIDDIKIAPFHLLASEGAVHVDKTHVWHMETLANLCRSDPRLLLATPFRTTRLGDEVGIAELLTWWEEMTGKGGEGMVMKPMDFVVYGKRGLLQPAIKCRGPEYLRIIYGPEYSRPEHLERLRERGLSTKRSMALREFALGIESLERFVRREPLRRVHECVFGVLALESEPVDPRL